MAQAQGIDFEVLSPDEAQDALSLPRAARPEGRAVGSAGRRHRPEPAHPGLSPRARATSARGSSASPTSPASTARRTAGEWRVKTDKGDIVCEIVVNAAGYRAGEIMAHGRAQAADRRHVAPVSRHRGDSGARRAQREAAAAARSRYPATTCARSATACCSAPTRPGDRRTGRTAFPDEFANQLWPDDLDRLESYIERGDRARADPRHGRRAARDQRPDPLFAGRQPLYRPGAGLAELLPVLLLLLRHRAVGRRGQGCWPNGSSTASRSGTSGASTRAATPTTRPRPTRSSARSSCTGANTPSLSRPRNGPADAPPRPRRSTTG